jgi:hypothetical protein
MNNNLLLPNLIIGTALFFDYSIISITQVKMIPAAGWIFGNIDIFPSIFYTGIGYRTMVRASTYVRFIMPMSRLHCPTNLQPYVITISPKQLSKAAIVTRYF